MDVAEDMYVANDLYEEDDFETGIRRGASPTRDGAPSPPRVQAMEVDSGTRTLRTVMRDLFGDVVELLKDRANRECRYQLWAKSTSILHLVRSFRPLAQQEFIECSTECRTDPLYTNLVVVMTNLSFSTALNDNSTALNDKSRK